MARGSPQLFLEEAISEKTKQRSFNKSARRHGSTHFNHHCSYLSKDPDSFLFNLGELRIIYVCLSGRCNGTWLCFLQNVLIAITEMSLTIKFNGAIITSLARWRSAICRGKGISTPAKDEPKGQRLYKKLHGKCSLFKETFPNSVVRLNTHSFISHNSR